MRPELQKLYNRLEDMDKPRMLAFFMETLEAYEEALARADQLEKAQTEMARQYSEMKGRLAEAEKENAILKKSNLELSQQLSLRKRDLFGAASEKTDTILEKALSGEQDEDPLAEDPAPGAERSPGDILQQPGQKKHGKKQRGRRDAILSRLPVRSEYILDIDRLNEQYGEGNWSIFNWTEYRTIESTRATKYVRAVFVPVISAGLERELIRIPYEGKLLKRSLVSPSLLAEIMYNKFVLSLPFYRQESDLERDGVVLSRTDMAAWCIRFAGDLFGPVYDYLCAKQLMTGYSQSDESALQVIMDGRSPSAVSYMWIHTTSELQAGNPIVIFCYELTRNTQHLRDYYLAQGFHGYITSDAYCSYGLLEKEAGGDITNCGCFMHARRRIVIALLVLNLKGKSAGYVRNLPEYKLQVLVNAIYQADEPLKLVSPEERRVRRQSEVRPKVDAYFDFARELDRGQDVSYSEKLRDAVRYSLNNEVQLRRFLDDPNIPIDNGFAERSLRGYAVGRRSWLFCYSVAGAEAMSILYSLAETARANKAHPYYYYKYLLEEMPKHMDDDHREIDWLEDMMPWSEVYRDYEAGQKLQAVRDFTDTGPVTPPKAPKQHRRPLKTPAFT